MLNPEAFRGCSCIHVGHESTNKTAEHFHGTLAKPSTLSAASSAPQGTQTQGRVHVQWTHESYTQSRLTTSFVGLMVKLHSYADTVDTPNKDGDATNNQVTTTQTNTDTGAVRRRRPRAVLLFNLPFNLLLLPKPSPSSNIVCMRREGSPPHSDTA